MLTICEAQKRILQRSRSFGAESIALENSLRRVLAADIKADRDYPPFHRSAMDGFAVRMDDLKLNKPLKIIYDLHAGDVFKNSMLPGECIRIMTGAPVPADADTVIRIEDAMIDDNAVSFSVNQLKRGQNIALRGEDAKTNDILLRKGAMIGAVQQSLLAVTGIYQVPVMRLPRVIIYSTGNEVRRIDETVLPHHIRDSNSYALHGLLQSYNITAIANDPVGDDPEQLKDVFRKGLDHDIMIVSGGVSKGVADHVPGVLKELGIRELFHGVKIKPGSPLWTGISENRTMVFALPGNPVSVQVAFKVFIEPFIRKCMGMLPLQPCYLSLNVSRNSRSRFEEYFPASLYNDNGYTMIDPLAHNGSGDISATAHSDGIALHPSEVGCLQPQRPVAFYPWHCA